MKPWDELQPEFRQLVLEQQHREGKTIPQIADELHVHRATLYRLIANQCTPSHAVHFVADCYVSHMRRTVEAETGE